MYAPHTITLYNQVENADFTVTNYITVLSGVMLQASEAANVRASGIDGADRVNLFIPFSVAATGAQGGEETYLEPKAFAAASDKASHWTLDTDGKCFFVKGTVIETAQSFQHINAAHDGVYKVTKVDRMDYGTPDMQHFEVGGA